MTANQKKIVEVATTAVTDAAHQLANKTANAGHDAIDTAADMAGAARSRLSDAMHKSQETAHDAREALAEGASATLASLREGAVERADAARETLSDVGARLAETLNRAADAEPAEGLKTRVLSSVAQGVSTAADSLRNRTVADLTSDLRSLARRHPGAFAAAAAVAGFAAARFVRSSAARRMAQTDTRNDGPHA